MPLVFFCVSSRSVLVDSERFVSRFVIMVAQSECSRKLSMHTWVTQVESYLVDLHTDVMASMVRGCSHQTPTTPEGT
jgi:hypothetical protein